MKKYIDKEALVKRIEGLKADALQKKSKCKRSGLERILHQMGVYNKVISLIDTLEVKEENDLESLFQALPEKIADEKSHQVYELSIYHYDGQCVVDYVGEIDHDSLYTFSGDTLYEAIEKAWHWLPKLTGYDKRRSS